MFILGLNLLDIFRWGKHVTLSWPRFLMIGTYTGSKGDIFSVILIGVATFFLPCGITQSIQIYALSSQNFWEAGLTMLVFALGTLPILGLFSFTAVKFRQSKWVNITGIFFKTAGIVLIGLTLYSTISLFFPQTTGIICQNCSVSKF
ncbi:MAG: hypothetical protein OHK0017_03780 [Patescibacteria group bacterium]